MPEETIERDGAFIDPLIERPEMIDRPVRKRALEAVRKGTTSVLKMQTRPILSKAMSNAVRAPVDSTADTFVKGVVDEGILRDALFGNRGD